MTNGQKVRVEVDRRVIVPTITELLEEGFVFDDQKVSVEADRRKFIARASAPVGASFGKFRSGWVPVGTSGGRKRSMPAPA